LNLATYLILGESGLRLSDSVVLVATQRITKATVATALRDSAAGKSYEVTDQEVRGLMLRVGPKGARWSFRVALSGKPTRWDLGNSALHEPDWYRALAREAHDLCKRGIDASYGGSGQ